MTATAQPLRAIIYARVSTAEQAASGLGIEAQVARCRAWADYRGHTVARVATENGKSGTLAPEKRPALAEALADLRAGRADVLAVAKLDRLGRSTIDVLDLADQAKRQGWGLAILDLDLDTTTANGRMVLTMFAALAAWERDVIAERTSAALQALKARGKRLGRPVEQSPEAVKMIAELRASGLSMAATAAKLNEAGVPTADVLRGRRATGTWYPSTVARVEQSASLNREAAAARKGVAK